MKGISINFIFKENQFWERKTALCVFLCVLIFLESCFPLFFSIFCWFWANQVGEINAVRTSGKTLEEGENLTIVELLITIIEPMIFSAPLAPSSVTTFIIEGVESLENFWLVYCSKYKIP